MGAHLGHDGSTPQVLHLRDREAGALIQQITSPMSEDCPEALTSPTPGYSVWRRGQDRPLSGCARERPLAEKGDAGFAVGKYQHSRSLV